MRIRSVKPEFFEDQIVGHWPALTRLVFLGSWCMADDCGRLPADVSSVRSSVAKWDREQDVERAVETLVQAGKLARYEVEGQVFAVVTAYWHQKIDKPNEAKWPTPPDDICLGVIEKALKNKLFRSADAPRLRHMFADASAIVLRKLEELSSPSRTRASGAGSREQGAGSPKPPEGGLSEGEEQFVPMFWVLRKKAAESLTASTLAVLWRNQVAGEYGWVSPRDPELLEFVGAQVEAHTGRIGSAGSWLAAQVAKWAKNKTGPARADDGGDVRLGPPAGEM
jgi:hypothetical protein